MAEEAKRLEDGRCLQVELSTYLGPETGGPAFAGFLGAVWDRLLAPTLNEPMLEKTVVMSQGARWSDRPFTIQGWRRVLGRVERGSVASAAVEFDGWFHVDLSVWSRQFPDPSLATTLRFDLYDKWTGPLTGELVTKVVELLREWAPQVRAATGQIIWDGRAKHSTPYEEVYRINTFDTLPELHEKVRTYAWATILTKRHMKTLGGVEEIEADAPVFRVERLGGQDPMPYLQLTEDITTVTKDHLKDLADYLGPVLMTNPNDWEPKPERRFKLVL